MAFHLYLLTNKQNGKQYIGVTKKSVRKRWASHVAYAKKGSPILLHRAIRKYGREVFSVECIAQASAWPSLLEAEKIAIIQYNCRAPRGYNLTDGGEGALGFKFTPEQLRRLSESHIGNRQSEATREKIRIASTGRWHSDEAKKRMSAVQKAAYAAMTETERQEAAAAIVAYSKSLAGRRDASKRMQQQHAQDDRLRVKKRGTRTQEAKKRMSEARKRFYADDATRKLRKNCLPLEYIRDIKALVGCDGYTQSSIARRYGAPVSLVHLIKKGECWAEILPSDPVQAAQRFHDDSWHPVRIAEPVRHILPKKKSWEDAQDVANPVENR